MILERDKVMIKCFRCGHIWEADYHSKWKCPNCSEIIRLRIVEKKQLESLHRELCPECPWDGETIFTRKEGKWIVPKNDGSSQ